MANYFECSVRYLKRFENGRERMVSEQFVIDAMTFTEAESRIVNELKDYTLTDFIVASLKRSNISEIIGLYANGDENKWYRVKINYPMLDERSGKERIHPIYLLINAATNDIANTLAREHFENSLSDFNVATVTETSISDVITR